MYGSGSYTCFKDAAAEAGYDFPACIMQECSDALEACVGAGSGDVGGSGDVSDCGAELELTGLDPVVLAEAPSAEEDWGQ